MGKAQFWNIKLTVFRNNISSFLHANNTERLWKLMNFFLELKHNMCLPLASKPNSLLSLLTMKLNHKKLDFMCISRITNQYNKSK